MKTHKMHKIQTIEKNKMAYKMKLKYFNIFNKHTKFICIQNVQQINMYK